MHSTAVDMVHVRQGPGHLRPCTGTPPRRRPSPVPISITKSHHSSSNQRMNLCSNLETQKPDLPKPVNESFFPPRPLELAKLRPWTRLRPCYHLLKPRATRCTVEDAVVKSSLTTKIRLKKNKNPPPLLRRTGATPGIFPNTSGGSFTPTPNIKHSGPLDHQENPNFPFPFKPILHLKTQTKNWDISFKNRVLVNEFKL